MTNVYAGDYCDCADCDLIIVCAGRNRKPGETRLDLTQDNIDTVHSILEKVKENYTRGVILVISNPVDVLTLKATEWMGLPDGMVFGSGCLLDSSRFVRIIADYLGISTGAVSGYLVGEHGESQIPIWSHVTVGGIPIANYCADLNIAWDERIRKEIADKTRTMGDQIIQSKGRTHYGIATCVCYLADAIINQRPIIASVCSKLPEEYGCGHVALSVPSIISSNGVQQRIKENWLKEEYNAFYSAADKVKAKVRELDCR